MLENINKSINNEENVTSGGESYSAPLGHEDESGSFSEKIEEEYVDFLHSINDLEILEEISYRDFVRDDTKSQRRKVNDNINKMYSSLNEVERKLRHALKLKTELDKGQEIFWKSTFDKVNKFLKKIDKIRQMTIDLTK